MKKTIQYGNGVVTLPLRAVTDFYPPDSAYLRVLLMLCANPAYLTAENGEEALAAACGLTRTLTDNALDYWSSCGILGEGADADGRTETAAEPAVIAGSVPQKTEQLPRRELPVYSSAQAAEVIEQNADLKSMIGECERIAGRLFSEHDSAQLAALYDTLSLEPEYILLVFAYCQKQKSGGKFAVSYAVKTALGLYDENIRTMTELQTEITRRETRDKTENRIKAAFGIGERALSKKERAFIECWSITWRMPVEVITAAYDITVDATGSGSMSYINTILSGWHDAGISTPDAALAAAEAFRQKKADERAAKSGKSRGDETLREHSFDADEFLNLAMKRSFKENG